MRNLFNNAVETTPAPQTPLQSTSSKQVTKSLQEIWDSCPEIAGFGLVSENENWTYVRAIDFDGKLLYKYAIKSKGEFSMETKYNWSPSKEEPNEFLGYPVRVFEQKMTMLITRERPAPVETPAPVVNPAMNPELMQQFMAFMQMQSQQQQSAAPKAEDLPF